MNTLDHLIPVIKRNLKGFHKADVLFVRPGFCSKDGWPTKTPGIIAVTSQSAPSLDLPANVDGVPVEVRKATTLEQFRHDKPAEFSKVAEHRQELRSSSTLPEFSPSTGSLLSTISPAVQSARQKKPEIAYSAPANTPLDPVQGQIPITCHVSPDAGWAMLKQFVSATKHRLAVSMYDFTSAHILQLFRQQLATKKLQITLDDPPKNPSANQRDPETIKELAGAVNSLKSSWALVRSSPEADTWIYPSAYHIKVMVRDGDTVWLSSGNLNNSNQPQIDPTTNPQPGDQETAKRSDRDWHVIVQSAALAKTFEAYLNRDFEVATEHAATKDLAVETSDTPGLGTRMIGAFRFVAPKTFVEQVTITPLFTPDPGVYTDRMLALINSVKDSLYVQLQYIHPSDLPANAKFTQLIDAVAAKIKAGKDVRVILSEFQTQKNGLEALQAAGVNLDNVKIQNNVHNKGFVVDHKKVVISSMNWSGEGVLQNRDAGVIIENATVALYYEKIFLDDWDHHAEQKGINTP